MTRVTECPSNLSIYSNRKAGFDTAGRTEQRKKRSNRGTISSKASPVRLNQRECWKEIELQQTVWQLHLTTRQIFHILNALRSKILQYIVLIFQEPGAIMYQDTTAFTGILTKQANRSKLKQLTLVCQWLPASSIVLQHRHRRRKSFIICIIYEGWLCDGRKCSFHG